MIVYAYGSPKDLATIAQARYRTEELNPDRSADSTKRLALYGLIQYAAASLHDACKCNKIYEHNVPLSLQHGIDTCAWRLLYLADTQTLEGIDDLLTAMIKYVLAIPTKGDTDTFKNDIDSIAHELRLTFFHSCYANIFKRRHKLSFVYVGKIS